MDNPVSVLNQDTSRNFLNSSDPRDKYKVKSFIDVKTTVYDKRTVGNASDIYSISIPK